VDKYIPAAALGLNEPESARSFVRTTMVPGLNDSLAQLQAIAAYPASAVVRPPIGEIHRLKQLLDIGAQTILVSMIETADHARAMVAAVRYPPRRLFGRNLWRRTSPTWTIAPSMSAIPQVTSAISTSSIPGSCCAI
jgi:HpcH/HpaI aldolase/citrate lyase family protein